MKESRVLEYKAEITNTFLKTVSAYANFGTGVIKFGIRNDGTVCGTDEPEKECLTIENKINDAISPRPDFTLSINRRTNVITLTVSEGKYKPYLYKGKAYRRNDTATAEVGQLELKRLILDGANLYYEELVCNIQSLKFSYLEKVLIKKLGISVLTDDILRTFGFFTEEQKFNIAAGLFADNNSYSGVDVVRFGNTINEIMERETFCQISILEQYDQAVEMFKRYYQYEKIEGTERVGKELIPEAAFREAIANAIVHRHWDINSHIRVSMYLDRIEIASPGGLPKEISKEDYLHGNISCLRNPIIGNIFFRLNYTEMFGTGIRRIFEFYEGSVQKPSFDVSDNSVVVILPVLTQRYNTSADGRAVIELLKKGIQLSSREIADKLGWSKDKAVRRLNDLQKAGLIKVAGNGRGRKYGN